MRFKAKVVIVFLSTVITLYAIIGGFLSKSGQAVARDSSYAQLAIFNEVLGHIIRDYVDEPDLEKVRIGSLRGLAEGLDPYSAYLTAEQAGIQEGDFIEYIGKIPSRDLSLYDVDQLLAGPPGTVVELRTVHQGQSHKVTVTLAKLAQPAMESKVEESGIGYLKITSLA